ncbi:MAG: aminoacyl-tRNA hydrolase [Bacilli bacterium]|nr:aminoacyl-tRNA hydrolase [Bacilli bacterium]
MKLIVGLGNPGKEYEGTRHNMGFMALDMFADSLGYSFEREGFNGEYTVINNPAFGDKIMILKPHTYMNLSGTSVREAVNFYKIDVEDIVVVYDEMAIPEGALRLRASGSSGGHKGIQNIIDNLGTDKIKRIRIGIGEPPHKNAIDYVLGKPQGESKVKTDAAIKKASDAIMTILKKGFDFALNRCQSK